MTDTLTQDEIAKLSEIAGLMIPESKAHKVPGANDPEILQEIVEDANSNAAQEVKTALAAWAGPFDDSAEASAFAETYRNEHGGFASLLQAVVNRVYYRNDDVMVSLGMEARSPFPKGFEVDQGDWSLLDPVKKMDPIWRPAS